MKYLLLLLLIFIVWKLLAKPRAGRGRAAPAERPSERMVSCARCGVNVPESEALSRDGRFYCTPAHLPDGRPTA